MKGATVVWGDMHQHYDIGRKLWYNCNCILLPEAPPNRGSDSSPSTPDTPPNPPYMSGVDSHLFVDAMEQRHLSLIGLLHSIESLIKGVEARVKHIENLVIHEQPPSSSRKHECHRGLTYREERLLRKLCLLEEEQVALQGAQPKPKSAVLERGKIGRVHRSSQ